MTSYNGFAYLYDSFMAGTPYTEWVAYIDNILVRHLSQNRKNHIVLDLACGTGNITIPLAQMGYDMIGVDKSVDMLAQAQAKATGHKILFLAQDMRELDLYGTVDAAICVCDGINYILSEAELVAIFKRVRMFLNPGGVFIFDMNTEYKFKEVLGGKIFTAKVDDAEYEWDNHFDSDTGVNEYRVTFMSTTGESFVEVHHQRAYPIDVICDLLRSAGFESVDMRNGYGDDAPGRESIRVVYVAC